MMRFLPLLLFMLVYAAFLSVKLWNCIHAGQRMDDRRRLQRAVIGAFVIGVLMLGGLALWRLVGLSASWAVLCAATAMLVWDVIADMLIFGVELPRAAATPPSAAARISGAAQMAFAKGSGGRVDLWRYLLQLKVGRG